MITLKQNFFEADDSNRIYYYTTPVNPDTRGILLILHGMSEHGRRYQYFADALFRKDIAAVIIDFRGHGATGEYSKSLGHFADEEGWQRILDDIRILTLLIQKEYPELPVMLYGHSMGSLAARCALIQFGNLYQKAVLCGTTNGMNPLILRAGRMVAKGEIKRYGAKHPSKKMKALSFGSYNQKFAPNRTEFDWLAENEAYVDAYLQDPLCGFICTSAFYRDMLSGVIFAVEQKNIACMPKDLPVLLIAGDQDPVGGMGKEVKALYKKMQNAGLTKVQLRLIPGKRHSILGESNRDETIGIIVDFLKGNQ